jgi:hypothetical protein
LQAAVVLCWLGLLLAGRPASAADKPPAAQNQKAPAAQNPKAPAAQNPKAPAAQNPKKTLPAHFTADAIVLDGVLDERVWSEAQAGTGFVQREPDTGKPASQRTEFRVVYTSTTLYIGLAAFDNEAHRIIDKEMQRDQPLWRDDAIDVVIDTFGDHRNAYLFETNPNGARTDALISDEGRDFNLSWNGVWQVASRRTPEGWFSEMAIPFSTLRFDPNATAWGLNVLRYIRRRAEQAFWSPILLDADVKRVSQYGQLTGIRDARQGWGVNVKPFAVGSLNSSPSPSGTGFEKANRFDYGLDAKWAPIRAVSVDLTVNTDFAESEADDLQTNLTRFSLFQAEKREFFLENSGIFEFGPGAAGAGALSVMSVGALSFGSSGSTGTAPLLKLFHSRQIGIDASGGKVPIDWGVRTTGRLGSWNIGFLDVQTDRGPLPRVGTRFPRTNFGALRVSRNLAGRSAIGMIYTDRNGEGDGNRSYGLDLHLRPNKSLAIDSYAARTETSGTKNTNDWSAGLITTWNGATYHAQGGWVHIGEAFEPQMGFILRRGVDRYNGRLTAEPFVRAAGILNFHFELDAAVYASLDGRVETEEYRLDLGGLRTTAGHEAKVFVTQTYDAPSEPFPIGRVTIPVGAYRFNATGLSFLTHASRPVSVEGQFLSGEFYDGERRSGNFTLRVRPNRFLRSETTAEINDVKLATGTFVSKVYRQRLAMAVTPQVLANVFVQYNDLSQVASVNCRFNWHYRPGSDIFLVYNQTWDGPNVSSLHRRDRQVMLKVTRLFQR